MSHASIGRLTIFWKLAPALLLVLNWANFGSAFIVTSSSARNPWYAPFRRQDSLWSLRADVDVIRRTMEQEYTTFYQYFLKDNEELWKKLADVNTISVTLFCPGGGVLERLGDKERRQLQDPRNLETTHKMGMYHVVGEAVPASQLFASGGVITLGGVIPVDRSVKGGFFGVGGQEDGGVVVGGAAKVIRSTVLPGGTGILHEVDALVSPKLLWRYMDQLRIPGSK